MAGLILNRRANLGESAEPVTASHPGEHDGILEG